MRAQFLRLVPFVALILTAGGTACNYSAERYGNVNGNIQILATDDPFPFDTVQSAKVQISALDMRAKPGGYIPMMSASASIELTQLRNGLTSVLADLSVPPGEYDQIRLIIDSGSVDLKDGRHFDMKVPSGAQSGLKIFIKPSFVVPVNGKAVILCDFDISKSFVPINGTNAIRSFNFKPVVRCGNVASIGSVEGTVKGDNCSPSTADDVLLAGVAVDILQNGSVVASAVTDANGFFKIMGLDPGVYDLSFAGTNHVPVDVKGVVIVAGQSLVENVTLAHLISEAPGGGCDGSSQPGQSPAPTAVPSPTGIPGEGGGGGGGGGGGSGTPAPTNIPLPTNVPVPSATPIPTIPPGEGGGGGGSNPTPTPVPPGEGGGGGSIPTPTPVPPGEGGGGSIPTPTPVPPGGGGGGSLPTPTPTPIPDNV